MYVYVITDGEIDYRFTYATSEEYARELLRSTMAAKRALIHPLAELRVKRITGWTHAQLDAAKATP